MSISKTIDVAMRQAVPNPDFTCNACERSGLPILLLRRAYAPHPHHTNAYRVAADSDITYVPMHTEQLRILRQGYVYVLLDQEVWHAYQVTPEGALRQFPAFRPPLAPGESLPERCATQDHDVIASFININTLRYTTAWIAFANDPWPRPVLDRYRDSLASNDPGARNRFVELDLSAARNDPASVGIAMTDTDLGLGDVLEYATAYAGEFTSVHGFYPRLNRLIATRKYVRTLLQKEQLGNGMLALILPDPVGMVMECNAQRTAWFQAMQQWRAEPERHFEYFTSQALLGIRELNEASAAAQATEETLNEARRVEQWNGSPIGVKAYLPPVDVEARTQRRTERKQREARERLEERYDENGRAAFQAAYDREVENWQAQIDEVGKLYAVQYADRAFQHIGYFDYSASNPLSVEYFISMMAACLAGGPTEVLPEGAASLGPTQHMWQQLLEDHQSLLYQALLAKHQDLMRQLEQALSGDDLGRVFDTVKAIIGSDEGRLLMIKPLQDAIGQLLAATASASNALGRHTSAQTRKLIGHVHSTAFLLYAGQPITQVRLSLTLGEYMSLLNEAVQERTDAFISQLDQEFRKPTMRKVRAMVLSGAINVAAAGDRKQMVEVMVWTLESAESLQTRLVQLRKEAVGAVGALVRSVTIGTDTLRHRGAMLATENLKVSAEAARSMASDAFRALREVAVSQNGAGLLLALGSFWFQQDSLSRNAEALQKSVNNHAEVVAAIWSSSFGALGSSVEATGLIVKLLHPNKITPGIHTTLSLGESLAKMGATVTALAGVLDGAQYVIAAIRTFRSGDIKSSKTHVLASIFASASALSGVFAAITSSSLLTPLGLGLIFGLTAYALSISAKKSESDLMDAWARNSRWGLPATNRHWLEAKDLDLCIGALNAEP